MGIISRRSCTAVYPWRMAAEPYSGPIPSSRARAHNQLATVSGGLLLRSRSCLPPPPPPPSRAMSHQHSCKQGRWRCRPLLVVKAVWGGRKTRPLRISRHKDLEIKKIRLVACSREVKRTLCPGVRLDCEGSSVSRSRVGRGGVHPAANGLFQYAEVTDDGKVSGMFPRGG